MSTRKIRRLALLAAMMVPLEAEVMNIPAMPFGESTLPPAEQLSRCLPAKLAAAGFQPSYIHGYRGEMFNRAEWMSKLGFTKTEFYSDFRRRGAEECGGPFRGICDTEIARYIGDQLAGERGVRHAIAWLTLNSHLPVTSDHGSSALLACGTSEARVQDEPSCELMALTLRAEMAVAKVAERPDLPETEFVVVGDHAPPFLRGSRRALFSQTEVPFVHLSPRSRSLPLK